jgi:hypothetical protein
MGFQGQQGDTGPKGDAGPKGDTGPQGPPGPALASFDGLDDLPCTLPSGSAGMTKLSWSVASDGGYQAVVKCLPNTTPPPPAPSPRLSLQVTENTDPFSFSTWQFGGVPLKYNVTVVNSGDADAANVVLAVQFESSASNPPSIPPVFASESPNPAGCSPPPKSITGFGTPQPSYSCNIGSVRAGGSVSVVLGAGPAGVGTLVQSIFLPNFNVGTTVSTTITP